MLISLCQVNPKNLHHRHLHKVYQGDGGRGGKFGILYIWHVHCLRCKQNNNISNGSYMVVILVTGWNLQLPYIYTPFSICNIAWLKKMRRIFKTKICVRNIFGGFFNFHTFIQGSSRVFLEIRTSLFRHKKASTRVVSSPVLHNQIIFCKYQHSEHTYKWDLWKDTSFSKYRFFFSRENN